MKCHLHDSLLTEGSSYRPNFLKHCNKKHFWTLDFLKHCSKNTFESEANAFYCIFYLYFFKMNNLKFVSFERFLNLNSKHEIDVDWFVYQSCTLLVSKWYILFVLELQSETSLETTATEWILCRFLIICSLSLKWQLIRNVNTEP